MSVSPERSIPSHSQDAFSAVEDAPPPSVSVPLIRPKRERDEIDLSALLVAREEEPAEDPLCSGVTEDGTLIPPPKENKLGPAAHHPFLRNGMISCRPGGPRLYDILNELPMDDFGVLAWSIIDREEEIYELEDIRDEDKVVLALWNRWIMLNRYIIIVAPHLSDHNTETA